MRIKSKELSPSLARRAHSDILRQACIETLESRCLLTAVTVTQFVSPDKGLGLKGMAMDAQGDIWLAEPGTGANPGRIGELKTDGTFLQFSISVGMNRPQSIAYGSDGNMWFTESPGGAIGRITPRGRITEVFGVDATFFALSEPHRRGILERLGRGPATLSELAEPSGLTLNGIKKHVGILERAGLVETEKVGRARRCRLGPATALGEAGEWIEAHRRAWEGRLDRFERIVERSG